MTDLSDTLSISKSGLDHQARRMRLISENIANVDTPGYRRKIPIASFSDEATSSNRAGSAFDSSPVEQVLDPGHKLANEEGFRPGSNVNLVLELAEAREAQRIYQANLKMFEQSKEMSSSLNELLRK